jgi:hypothetical protein
MVATASTLYVRREWTTPRPTVSPGYGTMKSPPGPLLPVG